MPDSMLTRVWSARAEARIFWQSARDWSAERPWRVPVCMTLLCRVDDVHVPEQRNRTAVRDVIDLLRLPLAVIQGAAEAIGPLVSDECHGIPEVWRARLIGDVAQHPDPLSVLDLPEDLSAELEVVTL